MRFAWVGSVRHWSRRGITLPLLAITLVGVCGFIALAVDVGRVGIAKLECQSAADLAAMAGARALNGIMPQDLGAATNVALNAVKDYDVMGQPLNPKDSNNVTITHGTYHYDSAHQLFVPSFTLQSGENYNLTKADVSYSCPTTFAQVFGISAFSVKATGTAAHRPRDVAIVLDFSGSMNNESDLWNCESYLDNGRSAPNNLNNTSNNSETVYPLFGHYSNEKNYSNYTNYANLLCPSADSSSALSGNPAIGKCNVSVSVLGVPAMVGDFWQNNRGSTAASGFALVPDSQLDNYNQAGGDQYLRVKNISTNAYATNVKDIVNSTSKNANWETKGYNYYTSKTSSGYIQGPRYWGKTFFIWPPDPTNDWRQKYFGTNDNTDLWDSSGNWKSPSGNYVINYKNILAWIKNSPNPFPTQLRSGNTVFYTAIPTDVPSSAYDHTQPNYNISNPDQRFWKEYIDYVVGVWRDPNNNIQGPAKPSCSYGDDYKFGTVQISSPPSSSTGMYMNYSDNPERPRHRLWFGPMTMVQFMSDTGLLPGTAHDISMYPMKIGVGGALLDIQANHPNDLVSMALFSRPQYNNDSPGTGAFNQAQFSLTNSYQDIITQLWVPPSSDSADVRPWDTNGLQTPRAHGDYDSNTASDYGFMLAYNQFSGASALGTLENSGTTGVGGLGRVGAQRLVIYETDGMANQNSTPTGGFSNGGAAKSYYKILPGQTLNSASYSQTGLLQVVQNICNNADGTPGTPSGYTAFTPNQGYPGYALPGKPVAVQCIAFGAIFEVPSSIQTSSVSLLQSISSIGGSTFPSSADDTTNGYKWCIGDLTTRQTKLRQAFTNIMNSGIPITLVK